MTPTRILKSKNLSFKATKMKVSLPVVITDVIPDAIPDAIPDVITYNF